MELEHNFTVAVPVDRAWEVLLDLERIAPCMPGAALTSYEGDNFAGTVRVKLGPVVMTFAGEGRFVERDEQNRQIVVEASGKDKRGGGTARATITAGLQPDGEATTVAVRSDLVVTGRVAQFGRGMIADVSYRLLGQFTECLSSQLGAPAVPAAAGAAEASAAAAATPAAAPAAETAPAAEAAPTAEAAPAAAPVGRPAPAPPAADGTAAEDRSPVGKETSGGTGAGGATPAAGAAPPAPASPRAPALAKPIDLLGVIGARAAARRAVPYLLIFLVGVIIGGGLVALLVR